MEVPAGRIILLNGFPGIGKLAIARALQPLVAKDLSLTRLIDNHLLIDPAQAIIPGRDPRHKALRAKIRQVAFEALEEEFSVTPELTVIMTNCLADTEEDIAVLEEHVKLAMDCGIPIYLVNIECDKEEHMLRLRDRCRYTGGKTKLSDEAILERMLNEHVLVNDTKVHTKPGRDVQLKELMLDTTHRRIAVSAMEVLKFVSTVCRD
jgi:chloramphenicol 3-O-phosphotransferase